MSSTFVEKQSCWEVTQETHSFVDPITKEHRTLVQTHKTRHAVPSTTGGEPSDELLNLSVFAEVHLLGNAIVRKMPRSESEEDNEPILREATIYTMLKDHPRIAQCLSKGQTQHVDTKYYSNGDLATYLQKNQGSIGPSLLSKWFEQIIEAVDIIHSSGVIHSDLALRQFFLDDSLDVRLGDFNASQYPGHSALGYEKAPHCLPRDYEAPNTTQSDLFAMGSTLYELVVGRVPYDELYPTESESKVILRENDPAAVVSYFERREQADEDIEALYTKQIFPDTSQIFGGELISSCWKGEFQSAKQALDRYRLMQWRQSPFRRLKHAVINFVGVFRERVKLGWKLLDWKRFLVM